MEIEILGAIVVIVFGVIIVTLGKYQKSDIALHAVSGPVPWNGVHVLLSVLGAFAVILGVFTVYRNIDAIVENADDFIFGIWLFFIMVFGMVVQVISTNYRSTGNLLSINVGQVIFPILFSIVVFYPIWSLAGSSDRGLFVIHAAFLNGYFWESIVSTARVPAEK